MRKLMLFAGLLLASFSACAGGAMLHAYALSGHGKLMLRLPAHWKSEVYQPPGGKPPTITLLPASGAAFRVMLVPLAKPMSPAEMEKRVRHASYQAAPRALEKNLMVKPLRGYENFGYYFSATDSAPKPGEFRVMNQGIVRVGDVMVSFVILTNDGRQGVVKKVFAMLLHARHRVH